MQPTVVYQTSTLQEILIFMSSPYFVGVMFLLISFFLFYRTRNIKTTRNHVLWGVIGLTISFIVSLTELKLEVFLLLSISHGLFVFALAKNYTLSAHTEFKKDTRVSIIWPSIKIIFLYICTTTFLLTPHTLFTPTCTIPQLGQNIVTNQCNYYYFDGNYCLNRIPWYAKEGCDDEKQLEELGPPTIIKSSPRPA